MAYFFVIPAVLSLLVLAAHFLRMRFLPGVVLSLVFIIPLLFRVNWITRLTQAYLLLAALEWLRATMSLINDRQVEGTPWHRAAVILLSVETFTVISAILLQWFIKRPSPGFEPVIQQAPAT